MTHLIGKMQLLDGIVQIEFTLIVLLPHFLMLNHYGAILEVDLFVLDLDLLKFSLEFLDPLLALLLYLSKADDFTLGLLSLQLYLIHL